MVLEQQEEAAQGRRKAACSLQGETQIFLTLLEVSIWVVYLCKSLCMGLNRAQSSCSIRENSQTHNQSFQCSNY